MKKENKIDTLNKKFEDLSKRFILLQRDKKRDELRLREAKREIQRLEMLVAQLQKRN